MLYFFNFNTSINLFVPVDATGTGATCSTCTGTGITCPPPRAPCTAQLPPPIPRNQNPPCILFTPALTCNASQPEMPSTNKIEPPAHPHDEQVDFSISNFSNALIFQLESRGAQRL